MQKLNYTPGMYSKSLITDIPADLSSEEYMSYRKTIRRFPDEAVYIYSFLKNRMVYAEGWDVVLGYRDNEINMLKIVESTTPEYAAFSNEVNDKAMLFLVDKNERLEEYSFTLELKKFHKNGTEIPIIAKVGVCGTSNGKVTEIIGRNQIAKHIKFGKIMQYAAYGPEKSEFEENLNDELFQYLAISSKEKETLELFTKGHTYKLIADHFGVTKSAIDKRVRNMFERFGVVSMPQLIKFASDNHIL